MAKIKRRGEPGDYDVLDSKCIGRECLQLGEYQVRGATLSGSRNTGRVSKCCLRRAYHGCPNDLPPCDQERMDENRRLGLKVIGF